MTDEESELLKPFIAKPGETLTPITEKMFDEHYGISSEELNKIVTSFGMEDGVPVILDYN